MLKPLKDKVFIKKNEKIDQLVKTLILVALILLVMSLIPAGIFAAIEGWSYGDAVYYTIITMTTIGFGDFVIGTSDNDYRALYKLLSSVWILLGLASVAMLLSNITDLYKRIAPESKTDDEEKDEKEKDENKESSEKEKPAETKDPIKA